MFFPTPKECKAAEDSLACGNVIAAANVLLASDQRDHREVRILRQKVQSRLQDLAREAFNREEISAAWQAIELARQCEALAPEAQALWERIGAARTEIERQRAWSAQRIEEARSNAASGHLVTGLAKLSGLEVQPEVQRTRIEIEERLERFNGYLANCRASLARQEWEAARKWLQRAELLMPDHPEVCQLAVDLRRLEPREDRADSSVSGSAPPLPAVSPTVQQEKRIPILPLVGR